MKFIASIDTVIYGRAYSQGAEVDISEWSRKQLLQCLDTGVIQGGSITASSASDSLVFSGPGVSTVVNADGNVTVIIEPIPVGEMAPLDPDVDDLWVDTSTTMFTPHVGPTPPPGDSSTWVIDQLWVDTSTELTP